MNINIGEFIYLSKAEDASGGRNKKSIIEDAVEALIAAIYFDGGLENVNKFVSKYIYPNIKELSQDPGKKDYKQLIETYPTYELSKDVSNMYNTLSLYRSSYKYA